MIIKLSILLSLLSLPICAEDIAVAPEVVAAREFESFTGRVAKGKVRLRATPTVDGFIVQELQKGEMLLVDGEQDGFYKVRAPEKIKGYVFRTFILDGKVEGSRVNVRLAPDLEAPVIAQLNNGDTIDGHIFSQNNKWIECSPPEDVRFFVASEYVEKVGDIHFIAQCEERKNESAKLLAAAQAAASEEFDKKFNEMNIEPILTTCQKLINEFSDCQEVAAKAKELISQVNTDYLARKISHLEGKAMEADLLASKLHELEPQLYEIEPKGGISPFPMKLTSWLDVEHNYIASFKKGKADASDEDFYKMEKERAIHLTGVLTPYLRPVKNKPGDYLLLDPANNSPLAYLYSTKVDLQDKLGEVITLVAAPRPNNHFAYPAYYVLGVEKH